jgi:hypothetical protein
MAQKGCSMSLHEDREKMRTIAVLPTSAAVPSSTSRRSAAGGRKRSLTACSRAVVVFGRIFKLMTLLMIDSKAS